ncbi:MAG: hypothetical protein CMN84_09270 [Spongiibacteraceae bacterium]|nr:hypothetical protein [Spongiibacteraceae bacterium]
MALVLCAGLAGLSWQAAKQFLAALNGELIRDVTRERAASPVIRDAASQALSLAPFNAEYHRRVATAAMRRFNAEAGLAHITQALKLRPAWPYDWLVMSHLLAANGVFDERMTTALSSIQATGAAERSLQLDTAMMVLAYWYHFNEMQRREGLPAIETILYRGERNARQLAVYIEKLQRVDLFCRRLVHLVEYGPAWCANFEKREKARQRNARKQAQ